MCEKKSFKSELKNEMNLSVRKKKEKLPYIYTF